MADKRKRIDAVYENLLTLAKREENNREQVRLFSRQMCDLIYADSVSLNALWQKLSVSGMTPIFKINLSRYLCEKVEHRVLAENIIRGDGERISGSAKGRIAYVRNKRNDKVFLEFSKLVNDAKAYYSASFTDACEDVFNNTCEFCILPIQNGKEGKLYSFYTMLERHELRIVRTVTEEETDDQESVSFALARRTITLQENEYKNLRYEFSLIGENAEVVSVVTEAVKELGGVLSDVGTLPVAYDQPRKRFYLSADVPAEAIIPLTLYFSLENMGFEVLGVYGIQ